ncbi:MAG: serine/threonine-protein kinase [Planctomycetota bacterium]
MPPPLDRFASDPRLQQLFLAALPLAAAERPAFLLRECDDPDLREAVSALLQGHDQAPAYLHDEGEQCLPHQGPALQQLGPYRILDRLGTGAMGVVYRAEQANPRREVALKVLAATDLDGDAHRRFRREVDLLARLQHPGIAQVFDAGTHPTSFGQVAFFAMELVRGQTLDVAARGIDSLPVLCELLARIADAVHHAHEQGVVHRDLKPANILVTRVDTGLLPKVLDFGIARSIGADTTATSLRTRTGMVVGTLPYMSPEQVRGGEVGVATDVYALGVIAFEVLAGRLPLRVHELPLADALRAIHDEEPPSLRSVRKDIDVDLATIVAVAMSKDADQRYPSAAAFAADLRRCVGQQPIHARPPTTRYRIQRFVRRHRRLVIATATAFVVLLAATIVTSGLAVQNAVLAADEHAARVALTARGAELRQQNYCLELNGLIATMRSPSARLRTEAALRTWLPTEGERDLRGFEWFLLNSLHKDAAPPLPTPNQAYNVHWHPTRPWLLVSGSGFTHVVDTNTRQRVADLGFGGHVYAARWSPDGTMIAASNGAMVVTSVAADGGLQRIFHFAEPDLMQRAVAWHHDNRRLAVFTYKGPACIVDRTGQRATVRIEDAGGGTMPRFQPDGDLLAIGRGIAHADDFTVRHRYSLQGRADAMEWNRAGTQVAIALRGRPAVFDSAGTLRTIHDEPRDVIAFAWSPDDRSLAMICGDGSVHVHDAVTWTLQRTALNHHQGADGLSIDWSPDGRWLAIARRTTSIALLDCSAPHLLRHVQPHQGQAQFYGGVQWHPDGQRLALSLRTATHVVDAESGEVTKTKGNTWSLRWSPDGQRRAHWQNPEVVVINADGSEQRATFANDLDEKKESVRLSWRSDSAALLVSCRGRLWLWTPGQTPKTMTGPRGAAEVIDFARTGDLAAIAGGSRVAVLDTANDAELVACEVPGAQAMQWSHDGRWIAVAVHDPRFAVEVREARTLRLHQELLGLEGNPVDVSWQVGDQRLGAAAQGGVCLWDPESGALAGRLPDASRAAWLAFSPDGRQLAVMDDRGAVLVYDARAGYR